MNKFTFYKKFAVIIIITMLIIPNVFIFITSEKPQFSINLNDPKLTLEKVKKYYHKNYGLKNIQLKNYLNFKTNTLKEHALHNRVVGGKNGWLYLGDNYKNSFKNAFGNDAFTTKEEKKIISNLKEIQTFLDNKDISFYFVIAPDKNQIYSENLPFQLNKKETKTSNLIKQINAQTSVNCFSLHKSLISKKSKVELYYKTDSHWNSYGAFIGYREIMKKINNEKQVKVETINNYTITKNKNFNGGLSRMLFSNKLEDSLVFKRKKEFAIKTIKNNFTFKHFKNPNGIGKLLIYRDSFTDNLLPFLNNTFKEVISIKGHNLDKDLIDSFKPDVVILEKIERNLENLTKMKSPLNF